MQAISDRMNFRDVPETAPEVVPTRAEAVAKAPATIENSAATEEVEEDERSKNLRLLREQVAGGGSEAAVAEEVPAEVAAWAKAKGLDPEDVLKLSVFKADAAEKQAELAKAQKNIERFGKIPTKLKNAIAAYDQGDPDWEKHLTDVTAGIDFSKKFEKQPKGLMLRAYANGKMTPDAIAAYEKGEADDVAQAQGDAYLELARNKFEAESAQVEGHLAAEAEASKAAQQRFKASRDASITTMLSRYPAAAPFKKDIAAALTPEKVLALFYDETKENTLRPEAAELVMRAMFSKEIVAPAQEKAAVKAKNDAHLSLVRREAELPEGAKNGQRGIVTPQQAAEEAIHKRYNFMD